MKPAATAPPSDPMPPTTTTTKLRTRKSDRFAVGHPSPHHHAEGREPEKREHCADHRQREQEIDQPPGRVDDIAGIHADNDAEIDHAACNIGRRLRNGVCAELALDDFLQHDRQAERHEDLFCVRALVKEPYQPALHGDADQEHDGYRDQDRDRHRIIQQQRSDVSEPGLDIGLADFHRGPPGRGPGRIEADHLQAEDRLDRNGAKRAEHEQGAMGEIDNTQSAENKCQAERNQGIRAPLVEPVQYLQQYRVHGPISSKEGETPPVVPGASNSIRSGVKNQAPLLYGPKVPPSREAGYSTCARGVTSTTSRTSNLDEGFSLPFTTRTSLKH